MKVTKQKLYQKHLAERALTMENVVELVKSRKTEVEIGRFRERMCAAYPQTLFAMVGASGRTASISAKSGMPNST